MNYTTIQLKAISVPLTQKIITFENILKDNKKYSVLAKEIQSILAPNNQ